MQLNHYRYVIKSSLTTKRGLMFIIDMQTAGCVFLSWVSGRSGEYGGNKYGCLVDSGCPQRYYTSVRATPPVYPNVLPTI